MIIDTELTALKPSKSTERPSMVKAAGMRVSYSASWISLACWPAAVFKREALKRLTKRSTRSCPNPASPRGRYKHDQYENQSDDRLPGFGEAFGLAHRRSQRVDDDRAEAGAEDRGAAADGRPHHHA